jgi:GT2 family glycosyltransferase
MVLPIVIVNYNNPADTIECIQSLLYLKRKDSVIVLVDNSDDIKSVSAIKNWLDNPVKVATLNWSR